jgi:hypothetical protein
VNTAKLADNAVFTAKLNDLAVQTAKLDNLAVSTGKLQDAAVATAKLADASVITAKIADLNVSTGKLADAAVVTAKLADGTVTAPKWGGNIPGDNLLRDSSFESDENADGTADYWSQYNNSPGSEPGTMSLVAGLYGSNAQRISWSVNNTSQKGIRTESTFTTSQSGAGGIQGGWKANATYTVSIWVKASGTNIGQQMFLAWNTAPATTVTLANPTLSSNFQRYAWRITWGSSVEAIGALFITITNGTQGTLDFDGADVEEGDVLAAYAPRVSELLVSSVGTAEIVANAITTAKIAAGQVTAAKIAANTITAGQIAAHTITANEIVAHTLTATEILAHTVTANEIAANTITANEIFANTITAAQIAAATITANELAANSITTKQLVISNFENQAMNPSFEDGSTKWTLAGTGTVVTGGRTPGTKVLQLPAGGGVYAIRNQNEIRCETGQTYYAVAYFNGTGVSSGGASIRIRGKDGTGAEIWTSAESATVAPSGFAATSITGTVPASVTTCNVEIVSRSPVTAAVLVDDVYFQRKTDGELIVDGAITAAKIFAHTITANEIAAGTITATEVATHTLTALQIASHTVTAAEIFAGTITATELAVDSITVNKVKAGEIIAGKISGGGSYGAFVGWPNPGSETAPPASYSPPNDGTDAEFDYRYTPGGGTGGSGAVVRQFSRSGSGTVVLKFKTAHVAGQRHVIQFDHKWITQGAGATMAINTNYLDSAGTEVGGSFQTTSVGSLSGWHTFVHQTLGCGSGDCVTFQVQFVMTTTGAASEAWVDNIWVSPQILGQQVAIGSAGIATANIANSAVTTALINDAAVTTAKINDGAVTSAKLDSAVPIAKAWANVSATCSTSTASLTKGANISSVSATNAGNGTVTVNFTTAMADANYIVVFNGWTTTGAGAGCTAGLTKSTTSFTCTGNVSLVTGTSTWYFLVYD